MTDPRNELSNQLAEILKNKCMAPDERREITITFRVSHAEKQSLEERCSGVVQSDYIRARLFEYSISHSQQVIPETNRQFIYELKRIGNNLNQQTRAINEAMKRGIQPLTNEVNSYLETNKELVALLERTRHSLSHSIQSEEKR